MNNCIPCEKYGFIILLREIIQQTQSYDIYSGITDSTIPKLNFEYFPEIFQQKYVNASRMGTACKVNINYITKRKTEHIQSINPILFNILNRTYYENDNLLFYNETDFKRFKKFKYFKSVNSMFYDTKNGVIKPALNAYVNEDKSFIKYPFNNSYEGLLSKNSKIYINKNNEDLYSNRIIIEYEDFFKLNNIELLDQDIILQNVLRKLSQNKVYEFAQKKNDIIWDKLQNNILDIIIKVINTLQT